MKTSRISFAERQPRGSCRIGSPRIAGSRRGFTLLELLVVIAIILTCAGLVFPVISKIRGRADGIKCANNLKQIGAATMLYAGDNNGALPGPIWSAQMATCPNYATANYELMYFLAPYLGPYGPPVPPYLPASSAWYSAIFECPSARKVILAQHRSLTDGLHFFAPSYPSPSGSALNPFGYPPVPPAGLIQPMRLVTLVGVQNIVALEDLDQKTPYGVGSQTVAAAPVHGSYRNKLYFDGHVQPIPIKP